MPSYATLGELANTRTTLDVACTRCDRSGHYILAALARRHGRGKSVPEWLAEISADCPRRLDPSPSIYELCGVHCPGLASRR